MPQSFRRFCVVAVFCTAFFFAAWVSTAWIVAQDATEQTAADAPASTVTQAESADARESEQVTAKTKSSGFLAMLQAGGLIGYLIILLSLVAVTLMIEHALSIRHKILMPPVLIAEIQQTLSQGQLGVALQKCQENNSVLADVLAAGMSEYELGWPAMEKATEEALAEEASRLYRKIEYLNVIGNIAPMLGLLGTVVGMVFAFQNLADSEGYARAGDLAEGIYLALVTTVQGLVVAIPSLAAYSIFSNRVAFLMAETIFVAEQVLSPIKRSLLKRKV